MLSVLRLITWHKPIHIHNYNVQLCVCYASCVSLQYSYTDIIHRLYATPVYKYTDIRCMYEYICMSICGHSHRIPTESMIRIVVFTSDTQTNTHTFIYRFFQAYCSL